MSRVLIELMERVARLEQRLASVAVHGPVHEVDTKRQMARVRLGGSEQEPYLSPWVPYGQQAGKLKIHTPPTKGQNMTAFSPTGDPSQAVLLPFTWNNQFKTPSDKQDENVVTYGGWRLTLDDNQLVATKGGTTLRLTGEDARVKASKVVVESPDVHLGADGGKRVARIGDRVQVGAGSSAGMWPIVEGSGKVRAAD